MSSDKSGISGGADPSGGCATPASKGRVRDRIFETACDLFYRHGIHGVGVDAIAAEAGAGRLMPWVPVAFGVGIASMQSQQKRAPTK